MILIEFSLEGYKSIDNSSLMMKGVCGECGVYSLGG